MKRIGALAAVHENFLAAPTAALPDLIRPVVAESWRRSLALGVDPDAEAAPLDMSESELADYRANHPLAGMMPLIRRLLTEDADEAGHIVAVGDAIGRLLWVEGHHRLRNRAEQMQFVEGSLWSERATGTNAPGTALALDHGIQIRGAEHFNRIVHPWSCTAVPVHDPLSGRILGVIDITGGEDAVAPATLPLLEAAVAAEPQRIVHRIDLAEIYEDVGDKAKAREQYQFIGTAAVLDAKDPTYKRQAEERLKKLG